MPVYQLVHSGAPLSLSQRDRIAKRILKVHHSITNAPEPFVRVVFTPAPLGSIYTAGVVAPSIILNCQIRQGRDQDALQRLLRGMYELVSEETKLAPDEIVVAVQQTPGPHMIEAGLFMPEPTDEAEEAWVKLLKETYPGQYDDWGPRGQQGSDADGTQSNRLGNELTSLVRSYVELAKREGSGAGKVLDPLRKLLQKESSRADATS